MPQLDYFTHDPRPVTNRNVPKDAYIIAQAAYTSGEYIETYYMLKYQPGSPEYQTNGSWSLWKVGDWTTSRPEPANFEEMIRLDLFRNRKDLDHLCRPACKTEPANLEPVSADPECPF